MQFLTQMGSFLFCYSFRKPYDQCPTYIFYPWRWRTGKMQHFVGSQLRMCHGTTAQKVKREDRGGSVYQITGRVARRSVCAQGPTMTHWGRQWHTVHVLSWQLQTLQCRDTERRRGGGHDYRCTLTPTTVVLQCEWLLLDNLKLTRSIEYSDAWTAPR